MKQAMISLKADQKFKTLKLNFKIPENKINKLNNLLQINMLKIKELVINKISNNY